MVLGLSTNEHKFVMDNQYSNSTEVAVVTDQQSVLPTGINRVSAKGRDMGTRFQFQTDENGNPVESKSNLRKALKAQGYKGNTLTNKVASVWNDQAAKKRLLVSAFVEYCFDRGMMPENGDVNKNETGATLRFKAVASSPSSIKKQLQDKADVNAALSLQQALKAVGTEMTFEAALESIKLQRNNALAV